MTEPTIGQNQAGGLGVLQIYLVSVSITTSIVPSYCDSGKMTKQGPLRW